MLNDSVLVSHYEEKIDKKKKNVHISIKNVAKDGKYEYLIVFKSDFYLLSKFISLLHSSKMK